MILSVSTCWHSHRCEDGRLLVLEARALGFKQMGLSRAMKPAQMPRLIEALGQDLTIVSHIEMGCPSHLDADVPADACVAATRASIELAAQVKAAVVVMQLPGPAMADHTSKLEAMAAAGTIYSRPYIAEKLALVTAREAAGDAIMAKYRKMLDELLPFAEQHGVRLATETAARYEDAPTEREMQALLEAYPKLGVWYDFGAVQRKANLGFLNHEAFLRSVADRVIGADLHDVEWPVEDHLLVGSAEHGVDFGLLVPLLPAGTVCALEIRGNQRRSKVHEFSQGWESWVRGLRGGS